MEIERNPSGLEAVLDLWRAGVQDGAASRRAVETRFANEGLLPRAGGTACLAFAALVGRHSVRLGALAS